MWGDMGRYGVDPLAHVVVGMLHSELHARAPVPTCWRFGGDMGRYGEIWGDMGEITRTYVLRAANLRGRTDDLVQCNVFRAPRGYEGGECSDYSGVRSTDVLRF